MRAAVAALAVFSLAACERDETPAGVSAEGEVTLGATRTLPDWIFFARTADGGTAFFNQRAITRAPDGTADIWLQIRHGATQVYAAEDDETRTTIAYVIEQRHHRYNCADETFAILNRQFMDSLDVVAREAPTPDAVMRPVPPGGLARAALAIACRGS